MELVFSALADANRRKIIEYLYEGNSTLLELSQRFSMSFQGLSKHIKVLEKANLIKKETKGKYRELSLNPEPLKATLQWISYYAHFWNESFDQLEGLIEKQNRDGSS